MIYVEKSNIAIARKYTSNIIKTVIAFANSYGGKIYIGIEDDGTVIGINNTDELQLQVQNAIRDTIKPDITLFTTYYIEYIDNKKIVVIDVQKGTSCPYYIASKGIRPEGVFVRQGPSTVPATSTAILNMIKETSGNNYEDAVSINQELTFNYMTKFFKDNELEINESKMKTLGLINKDNVYTNLALLFSDQCVHTIKLSLFQGTDMEVFKNRYELTGSILEQLDSAYKLLDMYNETHADFNALKRIDKRAYPPVAIREALLNAICHRDYSISASSLISIFSDRIEILSAGGLVSGIAESDIRIGLSALRNKNLANILYRLKLIEAYSTGIIKIEKSYGDFNVKPQIIIAENSFKIILPNLDYPAKTIKLTDTEKSVIEYAKKQEFFTRKALSDALNLSKSTAILVLKKLCAKGIISRSGNGKNIIYKIL